MGGEPNNVWTYINISNDEIVAHHVKRNDDGPDTFSTVTVAGGGPIDHYTVHSSDPEKRIVWLDRKSDGE